MATNATTSLMKKVCRVLMRGQTAHLSDAQLLESFIKNSDEAALEEVMRRHGPMVMGVCRRLLHNRADAEDAFQATFLVLVRKAKSIINRERVAAWLYTTACKTAMRSRDMASRRRQNESQVSVMPEPAVLDDCNWRDVEGVLDRELSLMPEKYREPIILCYIQGKTIREAAELLRCPEGTVSGRLSVGKAELAKRLGQQGIAVSAVALATALAQHATAAVPPKVASAALAASTLLLAGQTGNIAASKAVLLMNAVLRNMLLAKLKIASVAAILVLCGAAMATYLWGGARATYLPTALQAKQPSAAQPGRQFKNQTQGPIAEPADPQPAADVPRGVRLLAKASIPGDTPDMSEADGMKNRLGDISGIAYSGRGDEYVLVSGLSARDGEVSNGLPRFHSMKIAVKGDSLTTTLQATTILCDESGRRLGSGDAAVDAGKTAPFNPKGACVNPRGTIYVCDDCASSIDEFDLKGKRLKRFPLPARFRAQGVEADPLEDAKPYRTGAVVNRGATGLALTPDGRKLVVNMHAPLIQDGGRRADNIRLLEMDIATGKTREFLYALHDKKAALTLAAINDHEFLAIERGHERGCKLFRIDLAGASEIQHLSKLPAAGIPEKVVPVACEPLVDLYDQSFGLAKGKIPQKVRSLSFGPILPDGSRMLVMATDNALLPEQPTHLIAFALDPAVLRSPTTPR